jgi:hypothetical protein
MRVTVLLSPMAATLAIVLLIGPSACNAGSSSRTTAAADASCVALGSAEGGAPWSMDTFKSVEDKIGQHLAIVHWYQGWGPGMSPRFDANLFQSVRKHGSVPLLTWEPWDGGGVAANPFPLQRIGAGDFDDYIDGWAQGIRSYGDRVLLTFAHEMNGNWYPWGAGVHGNRPADYIAAYRHVHDRFARAGVTNVEWIWTPTADSYQAFPDMAKFYPGDAYTDWLGLDIYNDAATQFSHTWKPLSQLLAPDYQRLARLNSTKPMILVEWGSVEKGGDKGSWIRDASRSFSAQFPRVRAAVWFSADSQDLRIDSSPGSTAAARAAFNSPAFCGQVPAPNAVTQQRGP